MQAARADNKVVAFNTNGWLKFAVNKEPSPWPGSQGQLSALAGTDDFNGLYVRATHDNPQTLLDLTRFALLTTGSAFARWFINDAGVRVKYSDAVKTASDEILQRVRSGAITAQEGAQEAVEMRNTLLYSTLR